MSSIWGLTYRHRPCSPNSASYTIAGSFSTSARYFASRRSRRLASVARRSSSALLRAVMSWTNAMNVVESPTWTAETVSSIGTSWPSRWSASSSTRVSRIGPSPVVRKRSTPARWASRYRSGISVSTSDLPIASARGHPKVVSAA